MNKLIDIAITANNKNYIIIENLFIIHGKKLYYQLNIIVAQILKNTLFTMIGDWKESKGKITIQKNGMTCKGRTSVLTHDIHFNVRDES